MPDSVLRGSHIVLGVAGGVAAYKAASLCRLFVKAGAEVEVVLTLEACEFIRPLTFTALTGFPAHTQLFGASDPVPHTRLGQSADLLVVAPTTAHLLARAAHGLADDLLSNVLLATRAPVVFALAMHTEMWEQSVVQRNLRQVRADGIKVIEPGVGELVGGDVGSGRLAEPEKIFAFCEGIFSEETEKKQACSKGSNADAGEERTSAQAATALLCRGSSEVAGDLAGRNILVTAGGTREPVDAVRFLGNRSSGKMGHVIAGEALRRGAHVTLVATCVLASLPGVEFVRVETAEEMAAAVFSRFAEMDVVVMAAAVADFRPAAPADRKLKKEAGLSRIELVPTVDILKTLGERKKTQFLVGFAAETEQVCENGAKKVRSKNLDLLVANLVGVTDSGFGTDTNRAWFCSADGSVQDLGLLLKTELSVRICDRIADGLCRR